MELFIIKKVNIEGTVGKDDNDNPNENSSAE